MRYISEGNTLPVVICNWLETVLMQDEFKKFISTEVDDKKLNLLTSCLKLKGNFQHLKILGNYCNSYNFVFRKYCV